MNILTEYEAFTLKKMQCLSRSVTQLGIQIVRTTKFILATLSQICNIQDRQIRLLI